MTLHPVLRSPHILALSAWFVSYASPWPVAQPLPLTNLYLVMKNLRYCLIALFALAPAFAVAQSSTDSLNIVVEGGDTFPAWGVSIGAHFEEGVNIGPLPIVNAEPFIACVEGGDNPDPNGFSPFIENAAEVKGNIVLVSRGSCQFATKIIAAANAGAAAVIIGNNVEEVPNFGGTCDIADCSIPATAVLMSTRDALQGEGDVQQDTDGDGEPDSVLDADQRAAQLELAQAAVKAYCAP